MKIEDIRFNAPLPSELFSTIAQQAAEQISENRKANKSSQIRQFYDELLMWHDKIHTGNYSKAEKQLLLSQNLPFIKMLKAKAAYAKGRTHVDDSFLRIFNRIIDQIDEKDPDTLKHGKLFFEAILGYRKAIEETKNY